MWTCKTGVFHTDLCSLEKILLISGKISYSDWNHIFNFCLWYQKLGQQCLFPAGAKLFFVFPFCFTVKEMKAKEICVGKLSAWGWAFTPHGSRTETHRVYSEGKIKVTQRDIFFFIQLILFCSVCQDIVVGDMCLSKRFKLFYTAASDLKAFQTLSRDQVLL